MLWIIIAVAGFMVAAGIVFVFALLLKIVDFMKVMDQERDR